MSVTRQIITLTVQDNALIPSSADAGVQGENGATVLSCATPDDWSGLDVRLTVTAQNGAADVSAPPENGVITMPLRAGVTVPGPLVVSLKGSDGDGVRKTADCRTLRVQGSASGGRQIARVYPQAFEALQKSVDARLTEIDGTNAQTAELLSQTRQTAVQAVTDASDAADRAQAAKTEVDSSAELAQTSANSAGQSAAGASASAADARISAVQAKGYADSAAQSADDAEDHMIVATKHATNSALSADEAKKSEANAKSSEISAKSSESTASQALSDLLAALGERVATLGGDGKLTPSQIPAISINDVFTVPDTDSMLALDAQRGDCALILSGSSVQDSYILAADGPASPDNWKKLGVSYVANAGHAGAADTAADASKINGKRIVAMTSEEFGSAVKDPDTLYLVAEAET